MMLRYIFSVFFVASVSGAYAQYFQYSQYNYTSQRINPAMVASSDYASVALLYRSQSASGDINLKSSILSGIYPILSGKTGHRWSGVGVSVMDDRASGIFRTQEASLSYAINIFLDRFQSLSLGFKGLYQQRRINLDGLFTGAQYVPDRGFDGSLYNGENIQFLQSNFVTFSTGLFWQETDRKGNRIAYCGFSLFDFNKPQDSFSGVESQLGSTMVFNGGIRIYENKELSLTPEILFTRSAANNVFSIGTITSYSLKTFSNKVTARIDVITKYVVGRSGIIGLQLHRENFSIGCSYDFPVIRQNAGNLSAFEVGIELRKLVDAKLKRKISARKKQAPSKKQVPSKKQAPVEVVGKKNIKQEKEVKFALAGDSVIQKEKPVADLKSSLKHKQDSAMASAEADKMQHQPLIIEEVTLHFKFEFNSSDLDSESTQYLDDLSSALKENEHLKIRLTGHTDNIGSTKFNQRLSLFRANTIRDYLAEKGIDPSRMETEGKGLTQPLNENKNEMERATNRRVELTILYED